MDNNNNNNNSTFTITLKHHESALDYRTELLIVCALSIFAIPANVFLIILYVKKLIKSKEISTKRGHQLANSFFTYMIEMCAFDTAIIVYFVLDNIIHGLHRLHKTQYSSISEISNFTCKFFIYLLRISSAMSNFLSFFLLLNRSMLVLFKYKTSQIYPHRLCLNTKYLSVFVFCTCTIANVFRLELLNLNNPNTKKNDLINNTLDILEAMSAKAMFDFNDLNFRCKYNNNYYSIFLLSTNLI
jgi:hypothetical protein